MKNLLLGFAVITLAVACKSGENNSVSDASTAEGPTAACASESSCSDAEKAACAEKTDCDLEAKAGCDSEAKAACSGDKGDAQVCPVTGEAMEN